MNEFSSVVGHVYVQNAVIPPGAKTFTAQMRLGEGATNPKAIGQLFSDYLTKATIPLTIAGSAKSTPIAPLNPALAAVKLASTMTGIQANLISGIAVQGSLIGLAILHKAESAITLANPLKTAYAIKSVKATVTFKPSSGAAPFQVGHIDYNLPSAAVVPAGGSFKTDPWPVSIDANLIQLLGMLFDGNKYFDVQQNVTVSVGGADGYNTEMYYYQDHVPFTVSIDGLPPIGISPNALSTMSLPSNLTSITDPAQLQSILADLLSGKTQTSAIPSITSASVSATASSSVTTTAAPSATETTTNASTPTTTAEATTTTNEAKPTTTSEAKASAADQKPEPTATETPKVETPHLFGLPF